MERKGSIHDKAWDSKHTQKLLDVRKNLFLSVKKKEKQKEEESKRTPPKIYMKRLPLYLV